MAHVTLEAPMAAALIRRLGRTGAVFLIALRRMLGSVSDSPRMNRASNGLNASYAINASYAGEADLGIHLADWLLENHPQLGGTQDVLHAALTVAATTQLQPESALRFYGLRESYGHPPSLEASNMAITACCHTGQVDRALGILQALHETDIQPSDFSVIMVIEAANFKKRGLYMASAQEGFAVAAALLRVFVERKAGGCRSCWLCCLLVGDMYDRVAMDWLLKHAESSSGNQVLSTRQPAWCGGP
jgi:pentatricopeptide repeat protein